MDITAAGVAVETTIDNSGEFGTVAVEKYEKN